MSRAAGSAGPAAASGMEGDTARLLAAATALPRLAWDVEDVAIGDDAVAAFGFTRSEWEASNTAFKPICLMVPSST